MLTLESKETPGVSCVVILVSFICMDSRVMSPLALRTDERKHLLG